MFDYDKFGHMTKQEFYFNLKQYEGTGVTYKLSPYPINDFDSDDVTVVFSFSKEEDLSVREVVNILGCNRSYAYRLIKMGRLKVTSKSPLRVTASSLAELLCRGNNTLLKSIDSIKHNVANQKEEADDNTLDLF